MSNPKDTLFKVVLAMDGDAQFDYLLKLKSEQLHTMKEECKVHIRGLKSKLVDRYRIIRPELERMKRYQHELRKSKEKLEVLRMILSLGADTFRLSGMDSWTPSTAPQTSSSDTLDQLFLQDVFSGDEGPDNDPPPPPPSPTPVSSRTRSLSPRSKIPIIRK